MSGSSPTGPGQSLTPAQGANASVANASTTTSTPQWLRKAQVILVGGSTAFNIAENFRFTFNTVQSDGITFNTAKVRLYNLADTTISTILGQGGGVEYSTLIINAGYQPPGNYGTVFKGSIIQFVKGRESNINSFLDVYAADGDQLNYVVVSTTLSNPVTQQQVIDKYRQAAADAGVSSTASIIPQTGGILPRGKVLFGLVMPLMRGLAKQRKSAWSVQNGVLVEVPLQGYLAGDIVKINAKTGLVGVPESTQQGVTLTCLLNPNIGIGQLIQINNAAINNNGVNNAINTTTITASGRGNLQTALDLYADVTNDGLYRVLVHEFEGDTRGNPWYSHLTVISADGSGPGSVPLMNPIAPTSAQPGPVNVPGLGAGSPIT